jgi:hypothetical protein
MPGILGSETPFVECEIPFFQPVLFAGTHIAKLVFYKTFEGLAQSHRDCPFHQQNKKRGDMKWIKSYDGLQQQYYVLFRLY